MNDDVIAQMDQDVEQEREFAAKSREETVLLQQQKQGLTKRMAEAEATNQELVLALEKQAEADDSVMGALEARNTQFCTQMQAATHRL